MAVSEKLKKEYCRLKISVKVNLIDNLAFLLLGYFREWQKRDRFKITRFGIIRK
jgi:hypothetical protein